MQARIIIPKADGERLSYELRIHHTSTGEALKIVFNTSEELFERWLFYLLRDAGAHVVTDDVAAFRRVLGLGASDAGVVDAKSVGEVNLPKHVMV